MFVKKKKFKEGENRVFSNENIRFSVIVLGKKGNDFSCFSMEEETVLVVISGRCSIIADKKSFNNVGRRETVFDGRAYAVYLPPNISAKIVAESSVEVAVCSTKIDKSIIEEAILITPEENKKKIVGKGNWKREVFDIVDDSFPATKLVVGETINPPGNWSSSPPHKHDENISDQEVMMEEVYFYKIFPEQGFALQRNYSKNEFDNVYTVENNNSFYIKKGYHPVVVAPGYSLYYLWILVGKGSRFLMPNDDPEHEWIKHQE